MLTGRRLVFAWGEIKFSKPMREYEKTNAECSRLSSCAIRGKTKKAEADERIDKIYGNIAEYECMMENADNPERKVPGTGQKQAQQRELPQRPSLAKSICAKRFKEDLFNMKKMMTAMVFSSFLFLSAMTGCEDQQQDPAPPQTASNSQEQQPAATPPDEKPADSPESQSSRENTPVQETSGTVDGLKVVANPDSVTVLVNKQYALPKDYEPQDLVYPNVPFIFEEKIEKRKLRKEAADALEKLFDGAKKDGILLAGVSGYRSYDRQKKLFESYVQRDGEAAAKMYSAVPGTSEHQTGLTIDVSGIDGKCAAESCFAGTPEADWLAKHAPEYGFIIRYPEDKVDITGYEYEPWHIRYVGVQLAKELAEKGQTLEEYYNAVPVSGAK